MNIKRTVTLAAMTIMLAVSAAAQQQDADARYAKELLQPGTEAPDFTLPAPDGTSHTLSSLRGSYVVLDFWASWCPDCRKDIPAMKELHDKYGQRIKFVSISFDDKKDAWTRCWDITGCITEGPELILSGKDEPYAYIVYRNGEPYSKLAVSGKSARFTDTAPVDNARYEVVAYDYEGAYSEPSEEMTVGTGTSIRNYVIDGVQVEMQPDGSGLTVSGSYDSASLYGVNGVCVATSVGGQMNLGGLAPGIYMLKIEKGGQTTVQKIMIGK